MRNVTKQMTTKSKSRRRKREGSVPPVMKTEPWWLHRRQENTTPEGRNSYERKGTLHTGGKVNPSRRCNNYPYP